MEFDIFIIMNFFGNIIWLIFGGFFAALSYFFGGLILCITIIGIPWGLQCFKLAGFVLWPFGRQAVGDSSSSGCLQVLANIIWIFTAGIPAAINHIVMGFILYITIVGIPWGRQHFKLLEISLMPFGKKVISK